ncbi:MAG TPA: ComEA family DNA-binding protein [Syntrophomonadaceae bacterium]|nr:ComEA family DNA-binding protein [Syntrophomonadaceae bacterium]
MDLERRYLAAIGIFLLLLSFGIGYKYSSWKMQGQEGEVLSLQEEELQEKDQSEAGKIEVYITGEVSKPGVYTMKEGDRVHKLIDLAMPTEKADLAMINLARRLADEEAIIVPARGEAGQIMPGDAAQSSAAMMGADTGKININTASAAEMSEHLPGIGPKLAERIVDYRTRNGGFKNIEQICEVSGIGEKRYEQIKDLICVR